MRVRVHGPGVQSYAHTIRGIPSLSILVIGAHHDVAYALWSVIIYEAFLVALCVP